MPVWFRSFKSVPGSTEWYVEIYLFNEICKTWNLVFFSWKSYRKRFRSLGKGGKHSDSPKLPNSSHQQLFMKVSTKQIPHTWISSERGTPCSQQVAINLFEMLVVGRNSERSESLRVALYVPWLVHSRATLLSLLRCETEYFAYLTFFLYFDIYLKLRQ